MPGGWYGATLWKAQPSRHELQARAQLAGCTGAMHAVLWRDDSLASVEEGRLRMWQLADGAARVRYFSQLEPHRWDTAWTLQPHIRADDAVAAAGVHATGLDGVREPCHNDQ